LALAVCLIKFHFIWLAALLLLRRRHAFCTFSAISGVLLLVPFLVNPDWLRQYYDTVIMGRSVISHTPISLFPILGWYSLPLAALATAVIARRCTAQMAFAWTVALAVLVSPHAYMQDYALFVPLVTLAVEWLRNRHPAVDSVPTSGFAREVRH
jgi:hypothetical protein